MHELLFPSLNFFCLCVKRRVHCTHSPTSAISEWLYCVISGVFLPTWLLCSWIEALQMLKPRFILQPLFWVIMIPHHCVNLHFWYPFYMESFLKGITNHMHGRSHLGQMAIATVWNLFYFISFECLVASFWLLWDWVCDSKSFTYLSLFLICG